LARSGSDRGGPKSTLGKSSANRGKEKKPEDSNVGGCTAEDCRGETARWAKMKALKKNS